MHYLNKTNLIYVMAVSHSGTNYIMYERTIILDIQRKQANTWDHSNEFKLRKIGSVQSSL